MAVGSVGVVTVSATGPSTRKAYYSNYGTEQTDIEHTFEASGRYTGTDADSFQIARAGIATGLVSIPLRYMHSTVEMVQLSDVEAVIQLIVAFIRRMNADEDFKR